MPAGLKIQVLWVGKTHEDWVRKGIEEYATRVRRYAQIELIEVKEERGASAESAREQEAGRLEKRIIKGSRVILMDEKGETLSSPAFAGIIGGYRDLAQPVSFVIGGAYGFSDAFRTRGDRVLSLSRMTFTHQMVRIFLLEQIYRGFTILHGEPYHH
jgi:23S rRNA (pseudouridine1915-N3)-methyltransferase